VAALQEKEHLQVGLFLDSLGDAHTFGCTVHKNKFTKAELHEQLATHIFGEDEAVSAVFEVNHAQFVTAVAT